MKKSVDDINALLFLTDYSSFSPLIEDFNLIRKYIPIMAITTSSRPKSHCIPIIKRNVPRQARPA